MGNHRWLRDFDPFAFDLGARIIALQKNQAVQPPPRNPAQPHICPGATMPTPATAHPTHLPLPRRQHPMPTANQRPEPPPPDLTAPPLPRRLACWLYEGMLLFAVVFVAGYLFSTLSQTRNALDNRHPMQGFVFVVLGIYFTWLWSRGQTLAMKTWHIRLVDAHGQSVTQWRALFRYTLSWLWVLPPLTAAWVFQLSGGESVVIVLGWVCVWALLSRFHPQRQYLHDALAGTRLIPSR